MRLTPPEDIDEILVIYIVSQRGNWTCFVNNEVELLIQSDDSSDFRARENLVHVVRIMLC